MIEEVKKVGRPYLFRYRPNNDFTLDEIENSYVFFQKRELLNDPFDSTPDLVDLKEIDVNQLLKVFETLVGKGNRKLIEKELSIEQLEKTVREAIPKFINKHGIACFSMLPGVNMPLLANYSNNHKGLYFQYNLELDPYFFNGVKPMNYQEGFKKIPVELLKNEDDIFKIFYLKQDNWSYESELRLVKENVGKHKINRKSLRNIICGYNCPEEYILKVVEANKLNNHVSIWKMEKPSKPNNLTLLLLE